MTLRPGAVKQARRESGLSLAQVGKGHVTAPAIYLVETGRTRPSLPTLEHIARRTGKPVEFFLADPSGATDDTQIRLAELESMVAARRSEEAIALGQALLALGSSAYRLGRIRYFLALAYLQSAKCEPAAGLLSEARTHFEAINDRLMLAECIGAQAGLATITQRPAEAMALAEKALEVCRSLTPVPVPTEIRLLGIVGSVHIANHDWAKAEEHYRLAIESAGAPFDLKRMADTYGELSVAYRQAGQVDVACRHDANVRTLRVVIADRSERCVLQETQQGDLAVRGERLDLIEKQGAALGLSYQAAARAPGVGERAARMAEQLTLDK